MGKGTPVGVCPLYESGLIMRNTVKQSLCVLLIAATLFFIFYNSAQKVPDSKQASASVSAVFSSVATDNGTKEPSNFSAFLLAYVRKAAHAVEFFVLGAELAVWLVVLRVKKITAQAVWNTLSSILLFAVTDESIQIFSGRGPKVQDVMLDFAGGAAAVLLVLLLYGAASVCRARKQKNSGGQSLADTN